MLFCGMVENKPRWPWETKRYKPPRLRQSSRMAVPFFHKGISRFQAEVHLMRAKEDGSFLIRDSETLNGAYVLCVLDDSKVHQYRILPGPDGKLHVQSETGTIQKGYSDLTELIKDYIQKRDQNGLATALVNPVPPEGSLEDLYASDDDDDDDEDEDDFEHPPPQTSPPAAPNDRKDSALKDKVDLLKNYSRLNLSGLDSTFTHALKEYVDHGYKQDFISLNDRDSDMPEFTKLLEVTASGLKRELDSFMKKMDILNDFLSTGNRRTHESKHKVSGPGMPSLMDQLSKVGSEILHLQTKAQQSVRLASLPSEYEYLDEPEDAEYAEPNITSGPFLISTYRPLIPQSKFEVKKVKHGKTYRLTLTVDLQNGRYGVVKPMGKDSMNQALISHETILHLIKSTKDPCEMDLVLDGKKKQTYMFDTPHARESFCLQIRQMKNMHTKETEIDQISMFIGTWNMGDTSPNQSLSTWLKCTGAGKSRDRVLGVIPHDLYVIGTQESSLTDKDWVNTLKAGLKACVLVDMELVEVCTMWGIRLAILIKPELKNCITRVQRANVRTGIANTLGNKGAVAITFYFNGTSFCFINTHLTSGDERITRRNQNYRDIIKGLTMSLGQKHLSQFDITNQFHHVFWLGDLNYRLEEDIQLLLQKIQERDINYLLDKDQLRKVQTQKVAFCGFQEADITFLPSYRLERNLPGYKYAWRKVKKTGVRVNSPSWCDRVLWRSYPGVLIENVAYGISEKILSSDHRPVFSSFNVGILSEFVQSRGSLAETSPVTIKFHSIEAQVKTCCKQYFQLVFHSSCFQKVYKTPSNTSFGDSEVGCYTEPVWLSNLPEMSPMFGDQDYLENQHILVSVVSKDEYDSYGEGVIALRDMFSDKPLDFQCVLLHQGEETGILRGKMNLSSKQGVQHSSSKKSSSYSLIAFDTEYHDPEIFVSDTPRPDFLIRTNRSASTMHHSTTKTKSGSRHGSSSTMSSHSAAPVYDIIEPQRLMSTRVDSRAPHPLPGGALLQPAAPPRKTTPVMGQMGLLQGSQRQNLRQGPPLPSPPDAPPPPVPPKKSTAKEDQLAYEHLKRPMTLEEWLAQLNLSCYEQNFIQNGWDSLMYMNELSITDLIEMDINAADHQSRILESVKELNKV